MPMPLSATVTSAPVGVAAARMSTVPPAGVYFMALSAMTRISSTVSPLSAHISMPLSAWQAIVLSVLVSL